MKFNRLNMNICWWTTAINNIKINHEVYFKNGVLYHKVDDGKRIIGCREVKNFEKECGKGYRQWLAVYGDKTG